MPKFCAGDVIDTKMSCEELWNSFDEDTKSYIMACFDEITVPDRYNFPLSIYKEKEK